MLDLRSGKPRAVVAVLAFPLVLAGRRASAQLPGLPAAQSAFPAPGLALALNGGSGDGRSVGSVAGATGVRRLQFTAAVGLPGAPDNFERRGISIGARLAGRLYRTERLGVSAFAGYGMEQFRYTPVAARPIGTFRQVPVGVSAGVRGLVGERPYAVSLAPMYVYTRWGITDTTRSRSVGRVAALGELALTSRIAAGVALELGPGGPAGSPLAGGRRVVGAGLSYALRRAVAR